MSALADILHGPGDPAARRAAWLALAAERGAAALTAEAAEVLARRRGADRPLAASGAGRFGAVACGSAAAARIGMALLEAGGSAADAAAGAGFAMMVADPPNASPAGRAHVIWARPGEAPAAIDGATAAPSVLPGGLARLPDARALPLPGAVRALLALHDRGGRLPLATVAGPARDLARDGVAVAPELAEVWAWRAPEIVDPDARRHYLPGGRAPRAGDRFAQPGLAGFFDRLIETGRDPFADPAFAAPFCNRLARKGGFWTVADLAAAAPREGEVVSAGGEGWRLASIGRQGWGHTLLRIVTLCAATGATDALEAELAHLLAVLRAFDERPEELRSLKPKPDPLAWEVLVARLGDHLPADWASPAALSDAIGQARGPAAAEDRDTTHLSVVDAAGMRVALTQSIGPHFGARVADPETGILIAHSYRMAEAPEPGARDVTEQCPCLLDIGAARYALGGAGSERIPGAVAAVIRALMAGAPLDRALAAPRSNWVGDHVRAHVDAPPGLEARLDHAGARVAFTDRGPVDHLGIVQAAGLEGTGRCIAAADPAYAGVALAG